MGNNRCTGTVKWFSAKKGFGFILARVDGDGTDEQEIFVHQTSIVDEDEQGFRTLLPGSVVEFVTESGSADGKLKALYVTKPGGTPLKLPPRRPRQRSDTSKPVAKQSSSTQSKPRQPKKKKKEAAPREPPFHHVLTEAARDKVASKGFDLELYGTFDLAFGDMRIKLGLGNYAGLAHTEGIIAEGAYDCDSEGKVTFVWKSAIQFKDGAWTPYDLQYVIQSVHLAEDDIRPVSLDETPESLWGPGTSNPKEALEQNGFLMRRVVLTRPSRQPKKENDA